MSELTQHIGTLRRHADNTFLAPNAFGECNPTGWLHCGHRVCSVSPPTREEGWVREAWQGGGGGEGVLEEMGREGRGGGREGGKGICVGVGRGEGMG